MAKNRRIGLLCGVLILFAGIFTIGCEDGELGLTHTVTFNTNGGTSVESQKVKHRGFAITPPDPLRDNYILDNWYSDAKLNSIYDFFKTPVVSDITLYAGWIRKEYLVTFSVEGGTPVPPPSRVPGGETVARPADDPQREGFRFTGWQLRDIDSPIRTFDFDTPITAPTTLYAGWIQVFTATFNSDGGTVIESQTIDYGERVVTPPPPTREGYRFLGWFYDEELTQPYDVSAPVKSAITLHAKWEKKTFTITFDSNGGTAVQSQFIKYNEQIKRPADPSREDFDFNNWYSDGGLTQVFDFSTPITKDMMLYAKWEQQTFTVTFNSLGGTPVEPQTVNYDDYVTLPPPPTREGFRFVDWYRDEALNYRWYSSLQTVREDITLYAKWVQVFTVTFNSNGGTAVEPQTIDYERVVAPAPTTREGHRFLGWFYDEELTRPYDMAIPVRSAINLHAKWEKIEFLVLFDSRGGSPVSPQSVKYNESIERPADPSREGFDFDNWYSDEDLTQVFDFSTPITETTTLYAKWEQQTFTVTFDSRGGGTVDDQSLAYNDFIDIPDNPVREGFDFEHWYSGEDSTRRFDFNTRVTEDIVLRAKWKKIFTVTFDSRGGGYVAPRNVVHNQRVIRPANPTPPTPIQTFYDWYVDSTLSSVYDFNSPVVANITLYAKWVFVEGVPVQYLPFEGNHIVFDFEVDRAPSEDIVLEGTFSVDGLLHYANDEDYVAELEYSNDRGNTWHQENIKTRIKILASERSTRVRIPTVSDDFKEVEIEEFRIRFTLVDAPADYHDDVDTTYSKVGRIGILDDDVEKSDRNFEGEHNVFMGFEVEEGDFKLTSVAARVGTRQQKEIIDSAYTKIIEAVSSVNAVSPVSLKKLYLNYAVDQGEGVRLGFVTPEYRKNNPYKTPFNWRMTLNTAYVFQTYTSPPRDQPFNEDGLFGQTLVHEYGHLLTLNEKQGLFLGGFDSLACPSDSIYVDRWKGSGTCFFDNSYGKKIVDNYYQYRNDSTIEVKPGLTPPTMVSDYAKFTEDSVAEDLAESYTAYVAVGDETINTNGAAYLGKMALFGDFDESREFKQGIINTGLFIRRFGELVNTNSNLMMPSFGHQGCVSPPIMIE